MPKALNVIQFSLPKNIRQALESDRIGQESIGLTAKRKVVESYGAKSVYQHQIDALVKLVGILDQRISMLECSFLDDGGLIGYQSSESSPESSRDS